MSPRAVRTSIAAGGIALLIVIAGITLRAVASASRSCQGGISVTVAAAPEIAPVVLAMPKAAAQALGWPGGGAAKPVALADLLAGIGKPDTAVRLAVADPRRDATSLAGLITMGELAAGPNSDLTKVVVVDRLIG